MTIDEVRILLKEKCDAAGSQAAWAKAHKVGAAYVSDVIAGRREPGPRFLEVLGLERIVTFEKIGES